MGPVALAYGAATASVAAVALWRRRRFVRPLAGLLCINWIAYNLIHDAHVRESLEALPWMDFVGAILGVMIFVRRPTPWIALFASSFICQSAIHMGFWSDLLPKHDYDLSLNILYIVQLGSLTAGSFWPRPRLMGRRERRVMPPPADNRFIRPRILPADSEVA